MNASRRAFLASSVVALAAPAIVRTANGEAPHVLKLHHALSSVSCAHANFLAPWARNVEAQSNGRIRIDIFPSMQLGGQPAELFDQARDRIADIVWAMPSKTPGRFPRVELFELPFVPSRRALVNSSALEEFSTEFLHDEFREVRAICFSCADRGILHAHRPVAGIAEMKGLRLDVRTRFAAAAIEALAGRAVPMPSGQLALAISRRVVDGCVIPWDMVPALKLDELLNAHTDFADYALSTTTYVLAMNKGAYDKLPADLQKVIDANSGQATAGMAGAMWDLKARAVADVAIKRGDSVVTLAPDAVARWRAATEPVIDAWRKRMKARKIDGDKLLASAHSLFEKYSSLPEPQPPSPPRPPVAETKTDANPQPRAPAAPAAPPAKSVAASAPQVSIATPASHGAPSTGHAPAAPPASWWEFWKSAAPSPPASAAAVPPPAQAGHWWEFWKSAPAPTPSTAAAAPAASPAASLMPATPPAPPAAAAIVRPAPPVTSAAPLKALDIPL